MSKEFIVSEEPKDGGEGQFQVADAVDALEDAPEIQTTVTDPPYNIGHDYGPVSDRMSEPAYQGLIADVVDTLYHRTADDGSLFFIHYPDDVARLRPILTRFWDVHQHISWVYPTNFGHSSKRLTRGHRTVLWLKKEEPKFYPKRVVQPYKNPGDSRIKKLKRQGRKGTHLYDWWEVNLCKNVSSAKRDYANQLPEKLVRIPILATTDEGDTVADPFAGTYTVPRVALRYGRDAWGCDKNPHTQRFWPRGEP